MKSLKGAVVSTVLAMIITSWPAVTAQDAGTQRSRSHRGPLLIQGAANSKSKSVRIIGTTQGNVTRSGNRGGERERNRELDRELSELDTGIFDPGSIGLPFADGYPYGFPNYQQYPSSSALGGNTFELGYAEGFDAGNIDRIQGNLYNPRQYERSGDPDYFEGFVAGYRDGFRR